MNSRTETVILGGRIIQAPLRYEGEPLNNHGLEITAKMVHEARFNRGTLLYGIGVHGSKVLPHEWTEANVDVRKFYEMELRCQGENKIAEAFMRSPFHNEITFGPTLFRLEPANRMPIDSHPPILYSITPVLIPDRVHMEHVMEGLSATSLPGRMIHGACRIVTEARADARFMVA